MAAGKPTLIYFGTPELSVPPLRALVESGTYQVLSVVTQTDRPVGRGYKISPPPLKQFAQSAGIDVFQPASLKSMSVDEKSGLLCGAASNFDLVQFLNQHAPIDVFVVVAYGKIIPAPLISVPRVGIINVHFSLLPHLRGAAPIQQAVLNGDAVGGVTIMQIDEGLDTGPVYAATEVPILESDTSGTLTEKLVACGIKLLLQTLPQILDGSLKPTAQAISGVSNADKLDKADFKIIWDEPAAKTICRIRAGSPHPGAFTTLENEIVKILSARIAKNLNYPRLT